MPQFVAGSSDLILSAAQKDQNFVGGNTAGNHDKFIRYDNLFEQTTGSGIFRRPGGNSKQRRVFRRYGIDVQSMIHNEAIQHPLRPGQYYGPDVGNSLLQVIQNVTKLGLYHR